MFRPWMASFHILGLAICGFESLPLCGFLFMTRWSSCIFHKLMYGVEEGWWVVVSYPSSMWNVLFEICFESISARYRLRGISEDVEYKHRGMVLGSRIFWISGLEMLETSVLGLGQDLGLLSVLRFYAVTSRLSIYLSRFQPDSYRFKIRDRFSAYMTC